MKHSIILPSLIALLIIGAASCSKSDNSRPNPNPPGGNDTTTHPVDTNAGKTGTVTFTYRGQPVTYTTVTAKDGRTWLQQSLGSSRVATSLYDSLAFGHYFQFGRWDDGHQLKNSPNELDAAFNFAALNGGDSIFRQDWMKNTGSVNDKWEAATIADVTATNGCDPCKAMGTGWRLPTKQEWDTLVKYEGFTNATQAFASNLKLTISGQRHGVTGLMTTPEIGYYWSSTAAGVINGAPRGGILRIDDNIAQVQVFGDYSSGLPVRCILLK